MAGAAGGADDARVHAPEDGPERLPARRGRARGGVVVIGFGAEGRATVQTLIDAGAAPTELTIVDTHRGRLGPASDRGLVTFRGDARQERVLSGAGVPQATSVVVTAGCDTTSALVATAARKLAPDARIVVSGQEPSNVAMLKQAGADVVVVPEAAVGHLMARSTAVPDGTGTG